MAHRSLPRVISTFGIVAFCAVFAAAQAASAGLAGKWSGTVEVHDSSSGSTISTPIEIQLEERQPGIIAGKIGREGDSELVEIRNGKLAGDHVSFEAASGETSGAMKFDLVLSGDRLEGMMKGAIESQDIEGKVKLNRGKS